MSNLTYPVQRPSTSPRPVKHVLRLLRREFDATCALHLARAQAWLGELALLPPCRATRRAAQLARDNVNVADETVTMLRYRAAQVLARRNVLVNQLHNVPGRYPPTRLSLCRLNGLAQVGAVHVLTVAHGDEVTEVLVRPALLPEVEALLVMAALHPEQRFELRYSPITGKLRDVCCPGGWADQPSPVHILHE